MTFRIAKTKACHLPDCGRPATILTGAGYICDDCHLEGRVATPQQSNKCKDCRHVCRVVFAKAYHFCQVRNNRAGTPKKVRPTKDGYGCPNFERRTEDIPTIHAPK